MLSESACGLLFEYTYIFEQPDQSSQHDFYKVQWPDIMRNDWNSMCESLQLNEQGTAMQHSTFAC